MSYSFGMYFKQLNKEDDIVSILELISKRLYENRGEYIEENRSFIPSFKGLILDESKKEADEYWLFSLFNISCVYWKEYNLLGVSGYDYECLVDIFPTHIGFQNSCDQDYDYEEWGDLIDIFNQKRDFIKNCNVDDILNIMNNKYKDSHYSKEEILEDLEYYKKTALYEEIFNLLDLDNWLYDKPSDKFNRIYINALNSYERWLNCKPYLFKVREELKKEFNS